MLKEDNGLVGYPSP